MQCKNCNEINDLVCQTCYNEQSKRRLQCRAESGIEEKRLQLGQILQTINIKEMIAKNNQIVKQKKIQALKQRVTELKQKIEMQKKQNKKLTQIKNNLYQALNIQQQQKLQQIERLRKLTERNKQKKKSITELKKQKKSIIQKIMKIHRIDIQKYKMQKYFKFERIQNKFIFTPQNGSKGISVVKKSNEQMLKYDPIQNKIQVSKLQKPSILATIKFSSKLINISHLLFLNKIKLPYLLSFHQDLLKIGNQQIVINDQLQLNSEKFRKVLNMLQSDIQYMAYAIGYSKKMTLILDQGFFNKLQANNFETTGYQWGQKHQSSLKFLKIQQIENCHEELNILTERIPIDGGQFSKKFNITDDQFEVLQL